MGESVGHFEHRRILSFCGIFHNIRCRSSAKNSASLAIHSVLFRHLMNYTALSSTLLEPLAEKDGKGTSNRLEIVQRLLSTKILVGIRRR